MSCCSHNKTMAKAKAKAAKKRKTSPRSPTTVATKKRAPAKQRAEETAARWGSPENNLFADLVDRGKIKINTPLTLKKVNSIAAKHFPGRTKRSAQERIRDLHSQYRLEEDLAGGRIRVSKSSFGS
jgi:hypothetical protein